MNEEDAHVLLHMPLLNSAAFYLDGLTNVRRMYKSLPFDYIRCTFKDVIDCIRTGFAGFLPLPGQEPGMDNPPYQIYNMGTHCFFHHDFRLDKTRSAFERRIERFMTEVVGSPHPVVFVRGIISPLNSTEIALVDEFLIALHEKNPDGRFSVVMVGHRADNHCPDLITFEPIGPSSCVFMTTPPGPLLELPALFRRIITFISTNGLPNQKGAFSHVDLAIHEYPDSIVQDINSVGQLSDFVKE